LAHLPNETWQCDMTRWRPDGDVADKIVNFIDDD
jgi:hypothetical protein